MINFVSIEAYCLARKKSFLFHTGAIKKTVNYSKFSFVALLCLGMRSFLIKKASALGDDVG